MKKLVIMFVFCLFNLVSYSQVITVHKRTMDYKVENYDSTALKLDTLKTIITSNPKIKWVNFFENGEFIEAIKSKDIMQMSSATILSKIEKQRQYNAILNYYGNIGSSSSTSYPSNSTSDSSSSTSYYRDYETGYTIETHTNSHGGTSVIRDASGRIISTTNMSW